MINQILDDREKIKLLDKSNVLGSVEAFPDQITDAWKQVHEVDLPNSYRDIKNIVVVGMGGSALGAHILKHLYKDELSIPFEVISHYKLPNYCNSETLVILSSYSGTTEEPLYASKDAIKKNCKIIAISTGNKLEELARSNNWPHYKIVPNHNPSNQPRMAVGYSIIGQIGLLNKLGLIKIEDSQITSLSQGLKNTLPNLKPENIEGNPAKLLAYRSLDRIINLISSEHLIGAAHVFNNQLNENAKNMTIESNLPEFNHHYMEALYYPKSVKDHTIVLLIHSDLYNKRVSVRYPITKRVIENHEIDSELIHATAPTKLEQVFEIILLGAFTNFYLAMLNGIDPAPIDTVDYFKSELAKFSPSD